MGLISIDDIETYLQLDKKSHEHKTLLELLIDKYSALIERFCNRAFAAADYDEYYDGDNSIMLMLNNCPVNSIGTLTIDDIASTSDDYVFYSEGEIRMIDGTIFTKGNQNVHVVYNAGYAEVPDDVKLCCLQLIALKFKAIDSKRIGLASESVGDQTVSFVTSEFPDEIKDILMGFRKRAVLK